MRNYWVTYMKETDGRKEHFFCLKPGLSAEEAVKYLSDYLFEKGEDIVIKDVTEVAI